jgi:gliding motility-associated transport system permease protein
MRNVLAVAGKEVRSYFMSPIAYIVIGIFALLFGYFFWVMLTLFLRQSMQMMQFGGNLNVNQMLIAPVFMNAEVVLLFVLPLVTMRTYAEEKRSGTIELLLTSPLTDWQIILGKFLGAMTLFAAMLAVTVVPIVLLFLYGQPEWKPVITTYIGMLLMGGCFIALGLFISSLTKNQIVAAVLTFAAFLMFWVINWMGSFVSSGMQAVLAHLSIIDHFDDFAKGIIDTKHIIYYVTFITFGLFLTARAVDSERWRG